MNCPRCKQEYHCGCRSCAPDHKVNGVIHSIPEGDLDTCGHCGLTLHVDQWLNVASEAYKDYLKDKNE
jgi:hypothetical protein